MARRVRVVHRRPAGSPVPQGPRDGVVVLAPRPGRGRGEQPLASYIALVDTANGIAVQQDPTVWMFPNLDLTIHLHRQQEGPWTGLDTTVAFGPTGQGLTSSVLHDVHGPVGQAEQILTVRPQPRR
nr:acyl-CoA thioesterase domain-containing protein [Streptomyces wedmorensis]